MVNFSAVAQEAVWGPHATILRDKILNKTATVGVVGLGYVGLPLAVAHAKAGFSVIGVDYDPEKISAISRGISYIPDVLQENLAEVVAKGRLRGVTEHSALRDADVICIAVPTPLTRHKDPDLSYIEDAGRKLASIVHPGQLIVLESTTYPGTTEEVLVPLLTAPQAWPERSEFFVAFSPERVDPGNATYRTENTPKLVAGVDPIATALAKIFYEQSIAQVIAVSSPRVAEMAKVFENTYRAVNIALVNEMAMLCDKMDLSVWEVLDAAGTKPFGIQIFHPGPGVGGHCIPLDPFYLAWKAREFNVPTRFIDLAGQINGSMPAFVVEKLQRFLSGFHKKPLAGSKVLLIGVAYKRDTSDARESPSLLVWGELLKRGVEVFFHDPWVPRVEPEWVTPSLRGPQLSEVLQPDVLASVDAVLVTTDHTTIDYDLIVQHASLVLDTRNAMRSARNEPNVFKL